MSVNLKWVASTGILVVAVLGVLSAPAAGKAELSRDSLAALQSLYAQVPGAKALGSKSPAILVFPKVTEAGFMVGGQRCEGALIQGGSAVGYNRTTGGPFGLQAGAPAMRVEAERPLVGTTN